MIPHDTPIDTEVWYVHSMREDPIKVTVVDAGLSLIRIEHEDDLIERQTLPANLYPTFREACLEIATRYRSWEESHRKQAEKYADAKEEWLVKSTKFVEQRA